MLKRRIAISRWCAAACLGLILLSTGCANQDSTTSGTELVPGRHASLTGCSGTTKPGGSEEGEIFGKVFENGATTCDTTLSVSFTPDATTSGRLHASWNGTLRVYPFYAQHWEFWDPNAGAPCAGFSASSASSNSERIHSSGSTEGHCAVPGVYHFEGPGSREFDVEYIQPSGHSLTGTGLDEDIETTSYNPAVTNLWQDLDIHIDLTSTHPGDSPVLEMQNVGSSPYTTSFSNQATPSGIASDWFQVRASQSTSNWTIEGGGRGLAQIKVFSGGSLVKAYPYYDYNPENHFVIRLIKYADPWPDTIRTYTTVLHLMRPDEDPASSEDYTDTTNVTISTAHSTAVNSVTASIGSSTIGVSETTTASSVTRNSASETLTWHTVTWSSLDAGVATVNSTTGVVTGVAAGSTTIRATSDDGIHYGDVGVTVSAGPTITSFIWTCRDTAASTHHYNIFTGTWTYTGSAAAAGWEIRGTSDANPPSPGTVLASTKFGTTTDFDDWYRNDNIATEVMYFWVRYQSGAWYPADNGPVDVYDDSANICGAARPR